MARFCGSRAVAIAQSPGVPPGCEGGAPGFDRSHGQCCAVAVDSSLPAGPAGYSLIVATDNATPSPGHSIRPLPAFPAAGAVPFWQVVATIATGACVARHARPRACQPAPPVACPLSRLAAVTAKALGRRWVTTTSGPRELAPRHARGAARGTEARAKGREEGMGQCAA